ncbi:hypothetical protein HZA96_06050 [Candidatus Woesearchaeota archaeon]|nr:hypothetical protein [Candidatus Woesearchaeota archaeon]
MPKYLTKEEAFSKCKIEGYYIIREEINLEKIRSIITISESDVSSAKMLSEKIDKKSSQWNSIYKLYYDALHELTEAFLSFENIKSDNHQCLFAYLCEKHPELELNWEFFEKVRTKRNGINYYGTPIRYEDWKEVELQFNIYINVLKKEISKNIKEKN